ncbi:enoyl-CoA hydratase/isomerase family protein [Pseudonocardia sp. WMMC193]|uniref:enoyl-CoA hydratase/isomerase family protein n=1 Tax=Pseudonocardia sp. WMMC193 TaxID=2911965 RepID=UPI001F01FA86|nr:enoyl-CoA hydratase/isomerase family protein [Pseudonocardia sp. WMMC193]MCF7549510.1 enoyl-CoA hydratase-related protein [Pseudonocardia sp. WMMC193]
MGTVTTSTPRPGVRRLTLNRPDALNSMTAELIEELRTGLRAIREDSDVRAVVLTGAGRAFCAGIELRGYGEPPLTPAGGEGRSQTGLRVQQHISSLGEEFRRVRAPIVAAANGGSSPGSGSAPRSAASCVVRSPRCWSPPSAGGRSSWSAWSSRWSSCRSRSRPCRSRWSTWPSAVGSTRCGSLIAPLVGGLLFTRGVPGEVIFRLVAVPAILGAVTVAILVARIHRARRAATTDPVAA